MGFKGRRIDAPLSKNAQVFVDLRSELRQCSPTSELPYIHAGGSASPRRRGARPGGTRRGSLARGEVSGLPPLVHDHCSGAKAGVCHKLLKSCARSFFRSSLIKKFISAFRVAYFSWSPFIKGLTKWYISEHHEKRKYLYFLTCASTYYRYRFFNVMTSFFPFSVLQLVQVIS